MSKKFSESYLRYLILKSKPEDLSKLFVKRGAKIFIDEERFAEYLNKTDKK